MLSRATATPASPTGSTSPATSPSISRASAAAMTRTASVSSALIGPAHHARGDGLAHVAGMPQAGDPLTIDAKRAPGRIGGEAADGVHHRHAQLNSVEGRLVHGQRAV